MIRRMETPILASLGATRFRNGKLTKFDGDGNQLPVSGEDQAFAEDFAASLPGWSPRPSRAAILPGLPGGAF